MSRTVFTSARTSWLKWWPCIAMLCLSAGSVLAAGGGKPATKLMNVADTRGMEPGLAKWVADAYNGDPWLYGFVVVVVMALQGALLGLVFDRLFGLLGIKLGKLDHHE